MTEMVLKPCPFCGGVLEPVAFDYWGHPQNDCFLQAVRLASSGVDWWNTRAAPSSPVGEGVREKVTAIIRQHVTGSTVQWGSTVMPGLGLNGVDTAADQILALLSTGEAK